MKKTLYAKQYRYYRKHRLEGWKSLGGTLPPDVYVKVLQYKNTLMTEYRKAKEYEQSLKSEHATEI